MEIHLMEKYPLPFLSEQDLARKYFKEMPKMFIQLEEQGVIDMGLILMTVEQAMIMTKILKTVIGLPCSNENMARMI